MKDGVPHYLLLHYHGGHWEFARGHAEEGENEEQAARREVEEETGLKDLKIIPGFKGYTKFVFKRVYGLTGEARKKAPWVMKIVTLYLAESKTDEVKISHEHKGFAWLTYEQAMKKLAKDAKKVFTEANESVVSGKSV
jgi:8-oxo-dGTP pyrophosphatase MutT (NUDIX family)